MCLGYDRFSSLMGVLVCLELHAPVSMPGRLVVEGAPS